MCNKIQTLFLAIIHVLGLKGERSARAATWRNCDDAVPLEAPNNSELICQKKSCTFQCAAGYNPIGTKRTRCRNNNKRGAWWSKELGSCLACDPFTVHCK